MYPACPSLRLEARCGLSGTGGAEAHEALQEVIGQALLTAKLTADTVDNPGFRETPVESQSACGAPGRRWWTPVDGSCRWRDSNPQPRPLSPRLALLLAS